MIELLKYQVSTNLEQIALSEKLILQNCTTAEGHVTTKVGVAIDVHIIITVTYEI